MQCSEISGSEQTIRIAIWLPADIPGLELSLIDEIFQQTNSALEQKKYSLVLIKQSYSTYESYLAMCNGMKQCQWTEHFDYLIIASNSLPDKRMDEETKSALGDVLLRRHVPAVSINTGIIWLLESGLFKGQSIVTHWEHWDEIGERYPRNPLLPQLYTISDSLSCCAGKFALVDFLLEWLSQRESQKVINTLADKLFLDRVRSADEKQRLPAVTLGGEDIQPRLTMAIELMENNVEEPLSTDEIADYVHISRRQLERLFKRYLNVLPARYYLQLRLKHAQHLLVTTSKSIVQIGLMCGFSSGPHFSSSYKSYYGITPRDERAKRFRNNG